MQNSLNYFKVHSMHLFFILLICLFNSPSSFSQVQIWGVSPTGGSESSGSVFNFYDNGTGFLQKSQFTSSTDGKKPQSSVLLSQNGKYYGITSSGGNNNAGTIFQYDHETGFEVLHHLNPPIDGSGSKGDLIEVAPGEFIGTTQTSGHYGSGTIFKFSLNQGFSVLHHFQSSQGGAPSGGLVYDSQTNNIYGACSSGGSAGSGVVFLLNLSQNQYSVIHNFAGSSGGSYPQGGVVLASDGMLYGTTQYGGSNNQGSIFKLNPQTNAFEIIYSLNSVTGDGRYPFSKLIEAEEGVLAGTCNEGGTSGNGTVFKISTTGEFTRLRSLSASSTGGYPKAGLSLADEGLMYGVTEFGGSQGFGTIFTIDLDGTFTKVKDLQYANHGSNTIAPLTYDSNENAMIGTSSSGGANSLGSLFSLSLSNHGILKLHDFSMPKTGSKPTSIFRQENTLYGITENGGTFNAGVFYKIDLAGNREVLHHFNPDEDGQNPNGNLFKDMDGSYYGTTRFGGQNNSGTIFKVSTTGNFEVLHHFASSAQFPYGGVIKHSNGSLYGTLSTGGMYGDGILYEVNEDGEFSTLHDFFSYFDGGNIESTLTEDEDGNLYGIASSGGDYNGGSLFKYHIDSQYLEVVHHFNPYDEGGTPSGQLLLHSDGSLYGTAGENGALGGGALFKYHPDTGIEILHSFNPSTDGADSGGHLVEGETGKIYGFNTTGGEEYAGTCFAYSLASGFEVVYSFSSQNSMPSGAPALFFPECYDDSDCESSEACSVAICNYGICEEVEINPVFELISMSPCEVGMDVYDATVKITLDIHPGGNLIIGDEIIELIDGVWSYTHTFENLSANGEDIYLNYVFEESGCEGVSTMLGSAPVPCPPVLVHFVLDVGNLDVSNQGIFIGGNFQGWSPLENPMTLNEEGFWEAALEIGAGTYEFNFFNGPALFDIEYAIGNCSTNGKRVLTVGEESETFSFCWGNCNENCSVGLSNAASILNFEIIPSLVAKGESIKITLPDLGANYTFNVLDITGKNLLAGSVQNSGHEINTSAFSSGMYYLSLQNSAGMAGVKRFVVR